MKKIVLITALFIGGIAGASSFLQTSKNLGATDGSNAAQGYVGEYISSATASATNFPATTVFGDIVTISLTPGDWYVTGTLAFQPNAATATNFTLGISSYSDNNSTGMTIGTNRFTNSLVTSLAANTTIPNVRFVVATSTTVYLKYAATFSAGTPQASANLIAVRSANSK